MKRTVSLCWALTLTVCILIGCSSTSRSHDAASAVAAPRPPMALRPVPDRDFAAPAPENQRTIDTDLTEPGAVVWGSATAEIIDTALFDPQVLSEPPGSRGLRRVKEILPRHQRHGALPEGPPNDLALGGLLAEPRTRVEHLFPGIGQTAWVPPDPTLAAGPTHIVTTVNMSIAFYTRDGVQEFYNDLNNAGNPGFFEPVGAGGFTFDPKCFYDYIAERFVVLALEVYGSSEAWITIGVSDDSNPHGTWYKYRTDAVITVDSATFWWDYPGFGYDSEAYYVTGNLFGLNQGGWAGVGFRVFDKSSMLGGDPVQYATLRDGGVASVQVAQHFGSNPAPFFVSVASSSALRVHAITDPVSNPQLVSCTASVPPFDGPFDAPASGGNSIWLIDNRIMNAHWRDGDLYATHHISDNGRNFARWYHLNTGNWPDSGDVRFVQAGNIDAGAGMHSWFPAIYSNRFGEVGVVFGASSENDRISINTTGRRPGDPAGAMGAITQVKLAPVNGGGRWGDFYDIAVDPLDDAEFWIIGEYPESFGWATWITSFRVSQANAPVAVPDDAGVLFSEQSATIDVLANDYHTGGLSFDISAFDAVSVQGGTVVLSVGSGPGGRDELIYTAPVGYSGPDSFTYTITDSNDESSSAAVSAQVYDTADFRDPDDSTGTQPGVAVAYYALVNPWALPDFATLTPYADEVVTHIDYPETTGEFAGSGRSNKVGAVFVGYVVVPADDIYTFYLESDDGSRLYIGDQTVVDNDGLHGVIEESGTIGLKQGAHAIRVEFFENFGSAALIARIAGGGLTKQVIPPAMWLYRPPCPGDVNQDGVVDLADLAILLGNYGTTSGATYEDGDLDGDGDVDLDDLTQLLSHYGETC